MTREELVKNLGYLVEKYIVENKKRHELLQEIARRDFYIAKGVLHEINKSPKPVEQADANLIKEISFNFA